MIPTILVGIETLNVACYYSPFKGILFITFLKEKLAFANPFDKVVEYHVVAYRARGELRTV